MRQNTFDAAVTDFVQALGLLVRRLRTAGGTQALPWSHTIVMKQLANDGPATTADLARAQGMKPQSMGAVIAALEDMKLVERKPHPTDGRQMNIMLTAKGAALHKSAMDARLAWLAKAIAQLDEDEQKTLFVAGAIVKRLVEADPQ
jgi:DNA-binding MarR family transcriptional regulator